MIFINKKNSYIVFIVSLIIIICIIIMKNKKEKYKSIETISLPASGKTVVLDAGHGLPDARCRKYEWGF